jgi:hypothetical protein
MRAGKAFAPITTVLLFIWELIWIIAAAIAGWKLGRFIGELSVVKGLYTSLFIVISAIGPSLKLAAMGLLAFNQPWRLLNKQFRAEMLANVEEVKIASAAIKEIDWLGTKEKGKGAVPGKEGTVGKKQGEGYLELVMGGQKINLETIKAQEEINALQKMIAQSEKIESAVGPSMRTSLIIGLQERLNELEKIVLGQEANLNALNRQNIKPSTDTKTKPRINAGLE